MYTIGQVSEMFDLPISTLRYYDKEGLLPFVERSPGGMRMFQEKDYEWLQIIGCLKKDRDAAKEHPNLHRHGHAGGTRPLNPA